MKILVKFPSRGRPEQFLKVLRMMVEMSSDKENVHYLVTVDNDDLTMSNDVLDTACSIHKNIAIHFGTSKNKIDAINRQINHPQAPEDWDIVLLASDDMIPQVQGWDTIIRSEFEDMRDDHQQGTRYPVPNLDQALWFFDGHQHRICTLVVMGRKRYERFGYLYHPSYISLWCDNEWTEVNQPKKFDQVLFRHEHPAWGGQVPMDALYQRNEAYFERDRMNFEKRKREGFPIV